MSFNIDIARFAKKTSASIDESVRAITLSLFSGIIRDTRVDTGRLRGNWQTSVSKPITSDINRLDPSGSVATEEAEKTITSGDIVYMTNNLPYARVWNQRDAIIAKNMARLERTISEAVKNVR